MFAVASRWQFTLSCLQLLKLPSDFFRSENRSLHVFLHLLFVPVVKVNSILATQKMGHQKSFILVTWEFLIFVPICHISLTQLVQVCSVCLRPLQARRARVRRNKSWNHRRCYSQYRDLRSWPENMKPHQIPLWGRFHP